MKKSLKYLLLGSMALGMSACADLDTEYLGYYVSPGQKQDVLEQNPDMALASVTGIFSQFSTYMAVYSYHFDFGYPGIMIGMDSQTDDYFCKDVGYNHFAYWTRYSAGTSSSLIGTMMWYHMYKQIGLENTVLASIPADTENEQLKFYRANALVARAFDYWNLVQTFALNYEGHQNDPAVCIITAENQNEAAANMGAPRATVQEVYDLILGDLNEAITLLTGNKVTPSSVLGTKPKRMADLGVAYGMLARVNLTMHNYAAAATAAQNAIAATSAKPLSFAEAGKPGYNDLTASNWMWGIAVAETDRVVTSGIVNFPSMVSTFTAGYTMYGTWRYAGKKLYDHIPATDCRKGLFLTQDFTSPNISGEQQAYINGFIGDYSYDLDNTASIMPYTNVKFNSYQGVVGQTTNACDIPLMRVEEMYLILAEGQAMSGNTTGAISTLENFVQTYRDPAYTCKATAADGIQTEVLWQRRAELWGEGVRYFDMLRLNLDLDRTDDASPTAYEWKIRGGSKYFRWLIPESEVAANNMITPAQNNENYSMPELNVWNQ